MDLIHTLWLLDTTTSGKAVLTMATLFLFYCVTDAHMKVEFNDNFEIIFLFLNKHVATPDYNWLEEKVLVRGHNVSFFMKNCQG